jgi:hypothetical protein
MMLARKAIFDRIPVSVVPLTESAIWLEISKFLRETGEDAILIDPMALGIDHYSGKMTSKQFDYNEYAHAHPTLRTALDHMVEDGFFHPGLSGSKAVPNYESWHDTFLAEAAFLVSEGDIDKGILTLGPLVDIYPESKTLTERLLDLIRLRGI